MFSPVEGNAPKETFEVKELSQRNQTVINQISKKYDLLKDTQAHS